MHEYQINLIDDLSTIPAHDWDALTSGNPTLKHAFLQSMIDAGCTTAESGWLPQFITLWRDLEGKHSLVGAAPLYMKGNSYGEYVFDWAWAEAYQRAGLEYFPKLLVAVPFTPNQTHTRRKNCLSYRVAQRPQDCACLLNRARA